MKNHVSYLWLSFGNTRFSDWSISIFHGCFVYNNLLLTLPDEEMWPAVGTQGDLFTQCWTLWQRFRQPFAFVLKWSWLCAALPPSRPCLFFLEWSQHIEFVTYLIEEQINFHTLSSLVTDILSAFILYYTVYSLGFFFLNTVNLWFVIG